MKRSLRSCSPFMPLLIALGIFLAPGAAPLSAQAGGTASVHGVIVGADSLPLNAVEVTITHVATGATATAETDREGRYRLSNLRPGGPYTLRAAQLGMQAEKFSRASVTPAGR